MFAGDDMAEGLLAPAGKGPEALAGAEAFAAAIPDHALRQNPEIARQSAAPAVKQAPLLEIHAKHVKYQHRLQLEYRCNKPRAARPGLPTCLIVSDR